MSSRAKFEGETEQVNASEVSNGDVIIHEQRPAVVYDCEPDEQEVDAIQIGTGKDVHLRKPRGNEEGGPDVLMVDRVVKGKVAVDQTPDPVRTTVQDNASALDRYRR